MPELIQVIYQDEYSFIRNSYELITSSGRYDLLYYQRDYFYENGFIYDHYNARFTYLHGELNDFWKFAKLPAKYIADEYSFWVSLKEKLTRIADEGLHVPNTILRSQVPKARQKLYVNINSATFLFPNTFRITPLGKAEMYKLWKA